MAMDGDLEILLLGDPDARTEGHRLKLELDGYRVTAVATIEDAERELRRRRPDLVFLLGQPAEAAERLVVAASELETKPAIVEVLAFEREPVSVGRSDRRRLHVLFPRPPEVTPWLPTSKTG
jgi:hypothetical protein